MEEIYQILWGFCKKSHGTPGLFLGLKVHPMFIDNYPWIDNLHQDNTVYARYYESTIYINFLNSRVFFKLKKTETIYVYILNRKITIKERTNSSTTNDATTINSSSIDRKIQEEDNLQFNSRLAIFKIRFFCT